MKRLLLSACLAIGTFASAGAGVSAQEFSREVERLLPAEKPYDFHRHLETAPVHMPRRAPEARSSADETALPDGGWKLVWNPAGGEALRTAVLDFKDYLKVSMGVDVDLDERTSLDDWQSISGAIVVGTRDQLPGFGEKLTGPKDYRLAVTPGRVMVCGFDERGAMFGLYNLEARMNLREAPFLRTGLDTVRHSLYDVRMAQSWMGWMEFPDSLLSRMAHDGFDAIFAAAMTNPNGDRTTAETSTDFYARILHRIRPLDPARMHDLVRRASKYGIKVYAQVTYQYMGTPESEEGLRKLVRDIVREFPDIHGYVLLTEGFWYRKWGGQNDGEEYLKDWARNWSRAVAIVAEECHRVNPATEVLPWEYNINFRPENAGVKRYFIRQLPQDTTPLLSWENGKLLELDDFRGWVRDYSISQVGPAEVTRAQIDEARRLKMKVYVNGDTFVCGAQLQTVPYQPFPYQWHERYRAMESHGVNGTMESWSQGYNPSLMTEFRSWYCWSDAPDVDELLGALASRVFGAENSAAVLQAWKLFSEAIRLVPDTGPYMGTSNAVGNPIFFREPALRTATFTHSWSYNPGAMEEMDKASGLNPYWPFTCARMVFVPDFENKANRAEHYARFVSGVETNRDRPFLPVFLKYLRLAADKMEAGMRLYRAAALASPASKRRAAVREVVVAEQLQRMLESDHAILEFEDLRLKHAAEKDARKANALLGRMEAILRGEIERTERSLLAATRDSRLGFQQETDYVYTPYSLGEKLKSMRETLEKELPAAVSGPAGGDPSAGVVLPEGDAPRALSAACFPDRLHEFVWRNWNVVEPSRLAKVLGTSEGNVAAIAASMGLPPAAAIPPEMKTRGYISVLRRPWLLLPYSQLLEMLEMTPERLDFSLREEDFLWIKLGKLKPKCEPLHYSPPDDAARRREAEIRRDEVLADLRHARATGITFESVANQARFVIARDALAESAGTLSPAA